MDINLAFQSAPDNFEKVSEIVLKFVQIAFWLTLGVTAILTYRQAKRSIFQPMKNEIFKSQIEEFKAIIAIFIDRDDLKLLEESGLNKTLEVNTTRLYDEYAFHRFKLEVDPETRPYNRKDCSRSFASREFAEKKFKLMDGHLDEDKNSNITYDFKQWETDGFGMVSIPNEFTAYVDVIEKMASHPLLPDALSKKLKDFCEVLEKNLDAIRLTLDDVQKELAAKYPDVATLKRAQFYWIYSSHKHKIITLEPKARYIIDYIREYVNSDAIFKI